MDRMLRLDGRVSLPSSSVYLVESGQGRKIVRARRAQHCLRVFLESKFEILFLFIITYRVTFVSVQIHRFHNGSFLRPFFRNADGFQMLNEEEGGTEIWDPSDFAEPRLVSRYWQGRESDVHLCVRVAWECVRYDSVSGSSSIESSSCGDSAGN